MISRRLYALFAAIVVFFFLMSCASAPVVVVKSEPPSTDKAPMKPDASRPPDFDEQDGFWIHPPPPPDRTAIGCILPLSGRFADAGQKALDALLLSAGIFESRYAVPWKLIAVDSGETPQSARAAIERLATQDHVMAIIAMMGSAEADEAAREAQRLKVPLILITSREGVTEGYNYVFQHFLTPSQQLAALAQYAINRLNVAIFSILYPDDDYGREMAAIFRTEAVKAGGMIDKAVPYARNQTDFTTQIDRITDHQRQAVAKRAKESPDEPKPKMVLRFEALFIPDSQFRVKMIASQLAFYDVTRIALLGTSLWHSPELLKPNPEYLEGAVFADSFSISGFLRETQDFMDIYYAEYRREPGNIEALAYDTMEMTLSILEDGTVTTRAQFVEALLALERFRGATGLISFAGSQVAQKTPFLLQVRRGKLEQVR